MLDSTLNGSSQVEVAAAASSGYIHDSESLEYAVTHVFLPMELPKDDDHTLEKDSSLARAVSAAAHAYCSHIHGNAEEARWGCITKMLDNLQASVAQPKCLNKDYIVSQLCGMQTGDILSFFIRPQNAAVILTKRENHILYESFEVPPNRYALEETAGSLICSYPCSSVEVSDEVFKDEDFQFQLANFLSCANDVDSDLPIPPYGDSRCITALLTGILRGVGSTADVPRITKRIRDNADASRSYGGCRHPSRWLRSSLWLLVRIVIQLSVTRSPVGRTCYKQFMLFFICALSRDGNSANLSSDRLHLMSSKILRRLSKLGSPIPAWLSEMAQETCIGLRTTLDFRQQQVNARRSPFRNPSQNELLRDTQLTLLESHECIREALVTPGPESLGTPSFHPNNHRRGTIEDFLSSEGTYFEEAYHANPNVTLYDVERSVELGIDDWLVSVTNVEEACVQLEILMDKYITKVSEDNPEDTSVMALTAIELFVVLDKLVVQEIPILADYSPEIPTAFLEGLLLRKETNLHRLSCAYQYLSARHSQSRPGWSVLSNDFSEDCFPVRYYDQSPHLQHLKARIEQGAAKNVARYQEYQLRGSPTESAKVSQSLLPTSPLHAKVVAFELQCPPCFRIWRSAAPRILHFFFLHYTNLGPLGRREGEDSCLLARVSAWQPYFVERERPTLSVQIHFAYFYSAASKPQDLLVPVLCYLFQYPNLYSTGSKSEFSIWRSQKPYEAVPLQVPFRYRFSLDYHNPEPGILTNCLKAVNTTSHTSNDVLTAQASCPTDITLDEFMTFSHLRSGGSLQWLNILQGLRSRTLNLRRHEVHFLLARAAFQVGPLDLNTGTWIWHQELQDTSFCNALIDELENLFVDVGAGSIDGVLMNSISLLLTRVLASSPAEGVSKRAITLLWSIRRKTFAWVQELSYDLSKSPTNEERGSLLRNMAAACRSTFDVDPATLCTLFHSAEDVDTLLSCAFFTCALRVRPSSGLYTTRHEIYSKLLLQRDHRLSLLVEETLADMILADVSDYGIDLAVRRILASHKPGARRWERLQSPNNCWLVCKTERTMNRSLQTLHINLLDGSLHVDGKLVSGLPRELEDSPECQQIFHDQGFFVMPSNIPGADFTTLALSSENKVHFAVRNHNLVIRARCELTDDTLVLIPSRKLREDLPPALVDGHVHWLNLSTSIIEIRPLERLWEESPENWRIECASGQYRMYKGEETLVAIRSPTWTMVSRCFECLNYQSRNLLVTMFPANSIPSVGSVQRLSVALPDYGLTFSVNAEGELESHDFKDMVYDEDQCIGALIGLENLLVLRPKTHVAGSFIPDALVPRRVLIPNGFPLKHDNHQVQIDINCSEYTHRAGEPLYYTYNVDTELGCLTGNGSQRSMQLLAYAHSMTSWHRPDPLTGKTGVQAALCLLQSAGCRSITKSETFNSNSNWTSSKYPQINAAYRQIAKRHHWNYAEDTPTHQAVPLSKRAARRAGYLFSSNAAVGTSIEDREDMDYLVPESDKELEDDIFTLAYAVYCWSLNSPSMNAVLNWTELWSSGLRANTSSLLILHTVGLDAWLEQDPIQALAIRVNNILERKAEVQPQFQLLFLLPTMAYRSPCHQVAFLSMLIALFMETQSNLDDKLVYAGCSISDGYCPTEQLLQVHIRKSPIGFWSSMDPGLKEDSFAQFQALWDRSDPSLHSVLHPDSERNIVDTAVKNLLKDWPCETIPVIPLDSRFWNVESLTTSLQQFFTSCYRNFRLKEHLVRSLTAPVLCFHPRTTTSPGYTLDEHTNWQITLDQLFFSRPIPKLPPRSSFLQDYHKLGHMTSDTPALDQLFSTLQTSSPFQREYLTLLEADAGVHRESQTTRGVTGMDRISALHEHYTECRASYTDALSMIKKSLGPTTDHEQAIYQFGQWPLIAADVLLGCLASTSPIHPPAQWKECLVSLAQLLLEFQRARRLLRFALDGLEEEFAKELKNDQCNGWNAGEHPDWLLIQIQGNFLIRRSQLETVMEMMSPRSGQNTVMRVDMGEGKSSVIIPIVAATLADGKQLVRIIVPKSLTVQMLESLVVRLGGLANRPIYHLPPSRSRGERDRYHVLNQVDNLHKFMSQCMAEHGILLVQPEHVLTLKLTIVEEQTKRMGAADSLLRFQKTNYRDLTTPLSIRLFTEHSFVGSIFQWLRRSPNHPRTKDVLQRPRNTPDVASKWANLQKWIHSHVRDVLDESDEILRPRLQLIYAIGLEEHMDGYPHRWTITQQVLRLVKKCAYTISRNHPNSVEYEPGPPGSFPHFRIVQTSEVGNRLISLIVEDVMTGRLPTFNFENTPPELRDAIRSFISDEDVLQVLDTAKLVEEYAKRSHQSYLWNGLLLLRGLLGSNILLFALAERRWRVDYGLFPQWLELQHDRHTPTLKNSPIPTKLAFPYRAKDVPAFNTQFGHPDVTIVLTCLSYYYAGLTSEQLRSSFEILLDQDDPSTEYALWINEHDLETLPGSLQKLNDINLRSSEQWDKVVFPLFSRNQAAIDFYLSHVVFPKEVKEFPWKLSGSSWDLAERREKLVTGLSGTNDRRCLLPMSITQHDLDHQRGTNAKLLSYLLQPENNFYGVTHEPNGERQTTHEFLQLITTRLPEIRVLLDVGAQVLDLSNRLVAIAWLDIARSVNGAIYFSENDELMVLARSGITQSLSSSPLSQHLDRCVVYLDHAHTIGTDIKFPIGSRAAVTLGPKVTKDALVQGCMRMRKLGHGHSVAFFAPPGVDQSIRAVVGKKDRDIPVTTVDVLCWTIHETWADIQKSAPLWAQQGMSHKMRYDALSRFCNGDLTAELLSEAWLQPDRKSLVDLYAPRETKGDLGDLSSVPGMQQRCKDLGVLSLPSAQMYEEQEREVCREREREWEVDPPPGAIGAKHHLHEDVVTFVRTGFIPPLHSGSAFVPVFTTLEKSSAATREADVWSPSILATADFCRTIEACGFAQGTMDQYLRPVQWILSRRNDHDQVLVLLSPFETHHLLPDIRASEHVHLHLYAPRMSQRMKPSDDLRLYAIPPLPSDWTPPWDLIDQLNVFAGQLYLRDYESYLRLCRFLGVPTKDSPKKTEIRRNLFDIPGSLEEMEVTFSDSPLPSVMALLAIRSKGRPFAHTHMGRILQGQLLSEKDFERASR